MAPWCCDYQLCTISSSNAWIHVRRRFKSCLLRVLDLQWWESWTMISVGNKTWPLSSVNHSSKSIHSHHHHYYHHHHHHHHYHLKLFGKISFSWSFYLFINSYFYISKSKLNKIFPEDFRNVSYCYFQLNKQSSKENFC